MATRLPDPIASALEQPIETARVQGWWTEVSRRRLLRERPRRWPWIVATGVATVALLLALALRAPEMQPLALGSGQALLTSEPVLGGASGQRLVLDDRSTIALAPGAALSPLINNGREVVLFLEGGGMVLDLAPGQARRWSVEAGLAKVELFGAQVEIARQGERLEIGLSRGSALVVSELLPRRAQRLVAPARIVIGDEVAAAHGPTAVPLRMESAGPAAQPAQAGNAHPTAPADALARADAATKADAPPEAEASTAVETPPMAEAPPSSDAATLTPEIPVHRPLSETLKRIDQLRRGGHLDQAATELEAALQTSVHDPLAAIAAFTLGRIHSERKEPSQAARAFEQALEWKLPAALEDDAIVELITNYQAIGDSSAAEAWERIRSKRPQTSGGSSAR